MTSYLRSRLKRIPWLRKAVVQTRWLFITLHARWFWNVEQVTDQAHRVKVWDFTTPETAERNEAVFSNLEHLLPNLKTTRVFELGCADGVFTRELAQRMGNVVAADISTVGLDRARERCANIANIEFVKFDVERENLSSHQPFDVIFAMDVLEFLRGRDRQTKALDVISAGLRPGGILAITSCRLIPELREAYWQDLMPEGGDAHVKHILKRKDLTLLHSEFQPKDGSDLPGYPNHLIAFFQKNDQQN